MTADFFDAPAGYTAEVTAENLADLFGVSRPMIYKYRDAGMPQKARNTFDLRACVQWMIERTSRPQTATEETTRSALNNAQREKVELELARMRGELVPRDEVRDTVHAIASIVASQLDALGPRVAPYATTWATPAAAQAAILAETNAIRASIAARLRDYGAAPTSEPPAAAPAAPRKRTRRA